MATRFERCWIANQNLCFIINRESPTAGSTYAGSPPTECPTTLDIVATLSPTSSPTQHVPSSMPSRIATNITSQTPSQHPSQTVSTTTDVVFTAPTDMPILNSTIDSDVIRSIVPSSLPTASISSSSSVDIASTSTAFQTNYSKTFGNGNMTFSTTNETIQLDSGNNLTIWILIIVPTLALILCVLMIVWFWKKKKSNSDMVENDLTSIHQRKKDKNVQKNTMGNFPPGLVDLRSLSGQNDNAHEDAVQTKRNGIIGKMNDNDVNNSDRSSARIVHHGASKSHASLFDIDNENDKENDQNDEEIYGPGPKVRSDHQTITSGKRFETNTTNIPNNVEMSGHPTRNGEKDLNSANASALFDTRVANNKVLSSNDSGHDYDKVRYNNPRAKVQADYDQNLNNFVDVGDHDQDNIDNLEMQIEGMVNIHDLHGQEVIENSNNCNDETFDTSNWKDWDANKVNQYIEYLLKKNQYKKKILIIY